MRTTELPLGKRPAGRQIQLWLYDELRAAILEGRLARGARLPASRDLARQHSLSRGVVVQVYEQMRAEGYLSTRVGSGTRVNERLPDDLNANSSTHPTALRAPVDVVEDTSRPFHPARPALTHFPVETWTRIASRQYRRVTATMLAGGDPRGYKPLREAIADYVGSSRGVRCTPDHLIVTSGVQQGLDLLTRLLFQTGDQVWVEDPGYFGAVDALRQVGAEIVGVPVDDEGLQVEAGRRLAPNAAGAYVTPGHHFGLGVTMTAPRRMELLGWAQQTGAWILEDDYDSEFRFAGRPIPSLQGLDDSDRVIHLGTFNKTLFPALRLGYVVLPSSLVESFARLRYRLDRYPPVLSQAVLAEFISQGHFGRHLRRMRELYAERLDTLAEQAARRLAGALALSPIQAGLCTTGFLTNGMSSREAQQRASLEDVDAIGLHTFLIDRNDLEGLQLGFAGYSNPEIRKGVIALARALKT